MVERVPTGIFGLDDLLEGGFPKDRLILVSGACGSGKSIFALQFLVKGVELGEPGLFVTTDERPERLREDMLRFGWDLSAMEAQDKLVILDALSPHIGVPSAEKYTLPTLTIDAERLLARIAQICSQKGIKRVAIDSMASLGLHMKDDSEVRRTILKFSFALAKMGATVIVTSEVPEQTVEGVAFSKYGVEEYAADGVIILHYAGFASAGAKRTLFIRKMRGTRHAEDTHVLNFTAKGLQVVKAEEQ